MATEYHWVWHPALPPNVDPSSLWSSQSPLCTPIFIKCSTLTALWEALALREQLTVFFRNGSRSWLHKFFHLKRFPSLLHNLLCGPGIMSLSHKYTKTKQFLINKSGKKILKFSKDWEARETDSEMGESTGVACKRPGSDPEHHRVPWALAGTMSKHWWGVAPTFPRQKATL